MSSAITFDNQRQTYDAVLFYITSDHDADAMHK